MANGEVDVRTRLQAAALNLFRERGFERTTAAEIAARAGVTERTFFRYFPDKREILFDGEARLSDALTAAIGEAPADLGAMNTLIQAFRSIQPMLEGNRAFALPRQQLIAATPALQERELAKLATLTEALAAALEARGIATLRAGLAAQTGMAAFANATVAWLDDPTTGYGERLDLAFGELKALLVDGA